MKEIEFLNKGGVILYPTDTIWGLGCDATNPQAVERLVSIKGREKGKSLLILVEDEKMLRNYVEQIPEKALELLHSAGQPTTIIYPKARNLPLDLLSHNGSIGIRIPEHTYCRNLLAQFGKPIVSTSANFGGMPSPENFSQIDKRLLDMVDFVAEYEREDTKKHTASSIFLIDENGNLKQFR